MTNFESEPNCPTKLKLDQFEDATQSSSQKKIKTEKNSHQEGNTSFSDLPREIIHFILSFVTNDTQRRHIRSVCQQWFACINYNEFRIGFLLTSEVDEFSRCFGRYQKPIGLKFMKLSNIREMKIKNETILRSSHMFQSMLSSLTQLTALDLRLEDFVIPQELVNLQSLTVISPLHQDTISRLTNLRRLKTDDQFAITPTTLESLDLYSYDEINIAFDSSYSRLTELMVTTRHGCEIPTAFTNLRKLEVYETKNSYDRRISLTPFPILEEFITNVGTERLPCPSTLTKLHVFDSRSVEINENLTQLKELQCLRVILHDNSRMSSLEHCDLYIGNDTILQQLDPQKVTKLKTKVTPANCHIWYKFTNLIDLDIGLEKATSDTLPYLVPLTRLAKLSLVYKIYPQQWMTQVPNLVDLQLKLHNSDSKEESVNFEAMQRLTSLQLSGSYKSISIINLTNLMQLRIFNEWAPNAIIIQGLSTATNLTNLSVKKIMESTELASLPNLCMLSLDRKPNTHIINIADLTNLQRLTFLEVRASSQSTWYLTRLSRLQKISISTDNPDSVDQIAILKGLPFCYHFEVTE